LASEIGRVNEPLNMAVEWYLHRQENSIYLSLLLAIAISKDGNFSIEIASLFKNIEPSSHLYMKLKTFRQIIDIHILTANKIIS
jgi:hypothetical protein